jgi:uncharacterized protein
MKHLTILIKPASALCNMGCGYCFYRDVSETRAAPSAGVMTRETLALVVANLYADLDDGDHVVFAFQGGEPLLAGLGFFEAFIGQVQGQTKKVAVQYALQTNGLLIDGAWCAFLKAHRFLVGLSLDGPAHLHDRNRLDAAGKGTFRRVLNAKALLDQQEVPYNILSVLTREMARHPQEIWNFILKNRIGYVQFIPCLAPLGAAALPPQALTPEGFAAFYKTLLPLWRKGYGTTHTTSVKLFDDVGALLARGRQVACGIAGQCHPQFVVEADGTAYPCDFYCLDQRRLGSLRATPLRALFESEAARAFWADRGETSPLCARCGFQTICGGGCKRMRQAVCVSKDGAYCGYRDFLTEFTEFIKKGSPQIMY